MPKKAKPETPERQSERFRSEVARMIAAGELNPTEADDNFEKLAQALAHKQFRRPRGGETGG